MNERDESTSGIGENPVSDQGDGATQDVQEPATDAPAEQDAKQPE